MIATLLVFLENQCFNALSGIAMLLIQDTPESKNFSIPNALDRFNPMVTGRYQFESQGEKKVLEFSENHDFDSGIKQWYFKRILL